MIDEGLEQVKAERDRYRAALQEIAKVAEFLPREFEHDIAERALNGSCCCDGKSVNDLCAECRDEYETYQEAQEDTR